MTPFADAFTHPEDKAALENLKSIPLFSSCVQMFMKLVPERTLHGLSMAQKIRIGRRQLPEIYKYLPIACDALGIDEPEFYLEMDPAPNAYTQGDQRVFLTVTSGLLEYLQPEEIQAVVAHECGHIACHHVLYHTMADLLLKIGPSVLGPLAAVAMPVKAALFYWSRRSELSADRAAAVVMNGAQPVVNVMIRLAGGPQSLTGGIDVQLYLQQAQAYDRLLDSHWDRLLQGVAVMWADHPFLSVRSREIVEWCATEQFRRIVSAFQEYKAGLRCRMCSDRIEQAWQFCRKCGSKIAIDTNVQPSEEADNAKTMV